MFSYNPNQDEEKRRRELKDESNDEDEDKESEDEETDNDGPYSDTFDALGYGSKVWILNMSTNFIVIVLYLTAYLIVICTHCLLVKCRAR